MSDYDVIIAGAGPAGSAAAITTADAGLRVLVIERTQFPREKVCGDCINPRCWLLFEHLGVAPRILALPHGVISKIVVRIPRTPEVTMPVSEFQIAVKRKHLDQCLLDAARDCGAEILMDTAVTGILGASIQTTRGSFSAQHFIAADGRNSVLARLKGFTRSTRTNRAGLQATLKLPEALRSTIELRLFREGYCGLADIGDSLNLCLVAPPRTLQSMKERATKEFPDAAHAEWRTISPISRTSYPAVADNVLFVGDAARVTEPFTGEGIFFALQTGILAGECIRDARFAEAPRRAESAYRAAHARCYRGQLFPNRMAQFAAMNPVLFSNVLRWTPVLRRMVPMLTKRVMQTEAVPAKD